MKTVRFTQVIEKCGRPEVHLTWTSPSTDPVLQSRSRHHCVLTIHQHSSGSQKDFGVVGMDEGKDVQYLIFPKSLTIFAQRKVIGIDYGLLADALPVSAASGANNKFKSKAPVVAFTPPPKKEKAHGRGNDVKPSRAVNPPASSARRASPASLLSVDDEIRLALTELAAGDISQAKKRLRRLLRRGLESRDAPRR